MEPITGASGHRRGTVEAEDRGGGRRRSVYLDELERDEDLAADSVVVNYYTVTI